jgi:SagB-type dehydrogenase family enzyme
MTPTTGKRHLARWRNAVIVAFALGGITSATVGPRMPSLRADLGVDNAVIGALLFDLVAPEAFTVGKMPLIEAVRRRRSRRTYTTEPLSLEELSFLLWATQGVREVEQNKVYTLRTVPSGGARHPFETYLLLYRVTGFEPGLYRYLALEHKLCLLRLDAGLAEEVGVACNNQLFVGKGAATFVWTVFPYRTEWRYAFLSPKIIAQDAGHLCQNLYLACEAIGAGTCGIDAYDQAKLDAVLGVDGRDEYAVYAAPVGKVEPEA